LGSFFKTVKKTKYSKLAPRLAHGQIDFVQSLKAGFQSLAEGFGYVMGIQPRKDVLKKTDEEALASDWEAIGGDFAAVGRDIEKGMRIFVEKK
jgi:hypothetical protein